MTDVGKYSTNAGGGGEAWALLKVTDAITYFMQN